MKSRKVAGLAATALASFVLILGACTTDPEASSGSSGELDGVWMFTQVRMSWTEDGFTEKDTMDYDTSGVFSRQFYHIRDGILFWIQYDPYEEVGASRFTAIRKVGAGKWVLGNTDTASITVEKNRMTLSFSENFAEYDPWLEDTVRYSFSSIATLVRYVRAFPPPEWFEPAPTEGEPNDSRATANALEVGDRPLIASLTEDDKDWYSFQAVQGQVYLIRTYGSTDTYLELYRGATLVAENDDFEGANAGLLWECELSGTYHLRVKGYSEDTEGGYSIGVSVVNGAFLKPAAKKKAGSLPKHPLQQPTTK